MKYGIVEIHKVGMRLSILFLGDEMTEFSCEAKVFNITLLATVAPFFSVDFLACGGLVSTV